MIALGLALLFIGLFVMAYLGLEKAFPPDRAARRAQAAHDRENQDRQIREGALRAIEKMDATYTRGENEPGDGR